MRCLITGATGHLGSSLTRRLVNEGEEVFALVRPESDLWRLGELLDRIEIVSANLSDISSAARTIDQIRPEAVFHLGWQGVTSGFKNSPDQISVNVTGTLELFETVRSAGCKLWVGVGSQAEYGAHDLVLTEETPTRPTTAYGIAKFCTGLLTKKLSEASEMRFVWLRLLATYGPMDDERHLIPSVIHALLRHERPALTECDQIWDYLYVDDAADAIFRTAMDKDAAGFFNLGSGESRPVREVIERIRDLIDPALPLGFGDLHYPPDQQMRMETSIDRLKAATGWSPRVALDEGLRRTVEWYRSRLES